jgi:hypothetical protein
MLSKLGCVAGCGILNGLVKGQLACKLDFVTRIYLMYQTVYGLFNLLNRVIVKITDALIHFRISTMYFIYTCFSCLLMHVMRSGTNPNNNQWNVTNIWLVIWLETKWKPMGLPKFWLVLWVTIQTATSCQFFGYALYLVMPIFW